jgi:hypothetical protein
MKKHRIIVEVEGGVVQMVYSDLKNLRVSILDRDNQKESDDEENKLWYEELEKEIENMVVY